MNSAEKGFHPRTEGRANRKERLARLGTHLLQERTLDAHEDTGWSLFWSHVNCPLQWLGDSGQPHEEAGCLPASLQCPLLAEAGKGEVKPAETSSSIQSRAMKGACGIWRPNLVMDTSPKDMWGWGKKTFLGCMDSVHEPSVFTGM